MSQQQKENNFLGSRIAQLRKHLKMSMRGLARAAAIDVSYLSRLESGANTSPSRSVIERIAVALDATPEWILGGPAEIHLGAPREPALRDRAPTYVTHANAHHADNTTERLDRIEAQLQTLTQLLGATLAASVSSVAGGEQKRKAG
jgi:transcriptional regulator with XRE-family HTH domain